jgi:hypothetical protein
MPLSIAYLASAAGESTIGHCSLLMPSSGSGFLVILDCPIRLES